MLVFCNEAVVGFPTTPTAIARALLAEGWEPIPVNGKRPAGGEGWQRRDSLEQFYEHPMAGNVGIRCGRVSCVDIDILDVNLAAAAKKLAEEILGQTLHERKGRKGVALVYRNETPCRKIKVEAQPRIKEAPAVEILGKGQQFVAYGTHPDTGRPYEWPNVDLGAEPLQTAVDDLPEVTPEQLGELAQAVVELFRQHDYAGARITQGGRSSGERADDAGKLAEGVEFNTPHAIQAVTNYLKLEEPAVEGAAGDPHTIVVLNQALDWPVTPDKVLELALEHWNPRNVPPWEPDDLEYKLGSAIRSRDKAIGCKAVELQAFVEAAGEVLPAEDDSLLEDDDGPPYPEPDRLLCDAATIVASGIERRRPVYFGCFADYLSTTVAMSGLGKSAMETALAVSVATGKPLLGDTVQESGPVVMFNAEDRLDEMQRKVAAVCKKFGVALPKERLYLFSGRDFGDNPLLFALMRKGDFAINAEAFTWLGNLCERIKPLLLIMEPFGDLHALPENDNALIRRLVRALTNRIVEPHRLALEMAHHTSKTAGVNADVTQAASRGAQSLIDASRAARVLTKATTADLKALKIDIAGGGDRVVSSSNAKLSFLPPTSARDWFSLGGVTIGNGEEIQALRYIPPENVRPAFGEASDEERMRIYGEILAGIARDLGWVPGTGISYWKAAGLLLEHAQKLEERGELTPVERLRCGLARDRSNLQKSLVKNFRKVSAGDLLVVNRQDRIKFLEG